MLTLKGIPVSQGIAIGTAVVVGRRGGLRIDRRSIAEGDVDGQIARYHEARDAAVAELEAVQSEAETEMGSEAAQIFQAHAFMLGDPSLSGGVERTIRDERVTPEYAVRKVFDEVSARFQAKSDTAFQTKANDIQDLANRLLAHLTGMPTDELPELPKGAVVIALDLTPSQTANFDRDVVAGLVTELGGSTSHTAIIAQAMGIPAVVGCEGVLDGVVGNERVIVDGRRGVVLVRPDDQAVEHFKVRAQRYATRREELATLRDVPAITVDGTQIELLGNIEFPREVPDLLESGGEGVGLYRTEYLYLSTDREPTESDHYEAYRRVIRELNGLPLTVRTMDLGADKYTSKQARNPERNPFLGLRSIRYCLKHSDMFKTQLRAVLRASAEGPVRVMFPLVTNLSEFRQARMHLHDAMEDLDEMGLPFDRNLPVGMMIEVPAAALQASAFAREVDFFSIGTNDLVQYTLAVDRTNERVAEMYAPLHPAVLKLIRDVIRVGERRRVPVSCCGESAGDLEVAVVLLGLGLRTLSVTAPTVPRLKRMIRSIRMKDCETIARKAMGFDSVGQITAFVRTQLNSLLPEVFELEPGGG